MTIDAEKASHIHDTLKLILQIAGAVIPLIVVTVIGKQLLVEAQQKQIEAQRVVQQPLDDEGRTREILFADLDDAWTQYQLGDYSAEMWEGVRAHVTRNWNEQAMVKGWDELGWEQPKDSEVNPAPKPVLKGTPSGTPTYVFGPSRPQ